VHACLIKTKQKKSGAIEQKINKKKKKTFGFLITILPDIPQQDKR
jgi:hypothetical protein